MILLSSIVSAVTTDDLLLYYSGDTSTNLREDINQVHNGTIGAGAPTHQAACKIGGCWDFPAGANYFNVADSRDYDVVNLSVSVWVTADTDGGFSSIIDRSGVVGQNQGWAIATGTGANYGDKLGFWIDAWTQVHASFDPVDISLAGDWQHYVATYGGTSGTELKLYHNGTLVDTADNLEVLDSIAGVGLRIGEAYTNGDWDGMIDELGYWNRTLSQTDVTDLWNNGFGTTYPFLNKPIITLNTPLNNTHIDVNFTLINVTVEDPTGDPMNVTIMSNISGAWAIINSSVNVVNGTDYLFNWTDLTETRHYWNISADNGNLITSSDWYTLVVDSTKPVITDDSGLNDTGVFDDNSTLNITIGPDYLLTVHVNATCGTLLGANIYSEDYNYSGIYQSDTLTDSIPNYLCGNNSYIVVLIEAADTHTSKKIKHIPHQVVDKEIRFNDGVKIYPANKNKFSDVTTTKEEDRHTFKFKRSDTSANYDDFYLEGVNVEQILEGEYKDLGHFIEWNGFGGVSHWIDFNTLEDYPITVSKSGKDKYKVKVDCSKDGCSKDYNFKSLGGLNENNLTIIYLFNGEDINYSMTYDSLIVTNQSTTYLLDFDYNNLRYDETIVPNIILEFNSTTNYSASVTLYSNESGSATASITPPDVSNQENVSHKWYINFTNATDTNNILTESPLQYQTLITIFIGICAGDIVHPILNISYYDELTLDLINVNNAYDLNFTDGVAITNLVGNFLNNNTSQICTNLNASIATYNWDYFGTYTLTATNYINRFFTIPSTGAESISNNPVGQKHLYMIAPENSTTITYTWRSTSYQDLDGIMLAYRCEGDGTKNLVESVPIVNGKAVANIELLFPYSYEVIIGGVTYAQEAFTPCHAESLELAAYFVDLSEVDVTAAIGLLLVDCKIKEVDNDTVLMTWEDLVEDQDMYGCIELYREDIYNSTLVNNTCSGDAESSLTYNFPYLGDGNTYYLRGVVTFVDNSSQSGVCQNNIVYNEQGDVGQIFGLAAIMSVVFLLISMILIYSGQGTMMLIASMGSLVLCWVFGLLTGLGWITVTSMIAFLALVVYVGRVVTKK